MSVNIWPPSPPRSRDESPHRKKSSRSKRRATPTSDSDLSDSEDDRRRRHKKESKRDRHSSRKHKSSSKRSKKKRSKSVESDHSDEGRAERHVNEEEQWVEKSTAPVEPTFTLDDELAMRKSARDEDEDEVGPKPAPEALPGRVDEREYGGALLRGEGSAMAAFVAEGERIPRRGEIGLTSEEIEKYESSGYVMSGSRHRRMNAGMLEFLSPFSNSLRYLLCGVF
jgi:hypothetical protein